MIRAVSLQDAEKIAAIYAPYVFSSHISFELIPPDASQMRERIKEYTARFPWFVWEEEGQVVAFAYASQYRTREAYRWNAEISVYVEEKYQGRGVARKLYEHLISEMHRRGFVNLYAVIAQPNEPSVGFHESFGFTYVGVFKNVGYKFGKWHDVGWWVLTRTELPENPGI
jgi:L-amino acid N-acyltransferase YncA